MLKNHYIIRRRKKMSRYIYVFIHKSIDIFFDNFNFQDRCDVENYHSQPQFIELFQGVAKFSSLTLIVHNIIEADSSGSS